MSVAGYKNAKIPSLGRKQGKRRTTSLKLCNMKLDYTSRLIEMLRATCSADFQRHRPDSNDTKDTRVSAESRRKHTVTRKNVCSRQNCQPRETFDTPKPDARTTFNKDGVREILESRDIRQVPNKRRVEVQSQNRDSLIRDVCTCLAPRSGKRGGVERRGLFYVF